MDTSSAYRALIVDDDPVTRAMWSFALRQEGFQCDMAENGREAENKLAEAHYQLVVTDLRMPQQHGFDLAANLVKHPRRPVIMVHTAVDDPLVAHALLRLGVDDLSFKPGSYPILALRARVLVERSARRSGALEPARSVPAGLDRDYIDRLCQLDAGDDERKGGVASSIENRSTLPSVCEQELQRQLRKLAAVVSLSQAAIDVVDLIEEGEANVTRIAAAAARDPSLTVEVLKLANSSYFNPRGERILDLERAIMRIGLRRLAEMAIATTTLAALTTQVLPWMDTSLVWRRSLAAGVAAGLLTNRVENDDRSPGLFLACVLHGLGRVALGTVFPELYDKLLACHRTSGVSLAQLERHVFPISPGQALSQLLADWHFPIALCSLLPYVDQPWRKIRDLDPQLADSVSLLNWSILLGKIAVGRWEPWDEIDVPKSDHLPAGTDISLQELPQFVDQVRDAVHRLANFRHGGGAPIISVQPDRIITYRYQTVSHQMGVFPMLLENFGFKAITVAGPSDTTLPLLVYAVEEQPEHWFAGQATLSNALFVVRQDDVPTANRPNTVLAIPCSVAVLQETLQRWTSGNLSELHNDKSSGG